MSPKLRGSREMRVFLDDCKLIAAALAWISVHAHDLEAMGDSRPVAGDWLKVSGSRVERTPDQEGWPLARALWKDVQRQTAHIAVTLDRLCTNMQALSDGAAADPTLGGTELEPGELEALLTRQAKRRREGEYVPMPTHAQPKVMIKNEVHH